MTDRAKGWAIACAVSGWMWALIFYACIVLFATSSRAEALKGLDVLGVAKMQGKIIAEEIDPATWIGWLENTFGDAHPQVRPILDSGKVPVVRVHLIDGTCIRNRVCPKGAPGYRSYGELEKRAVRLRELMSAYPHITLYVSPYLEHDEKDPKVVTEWYKILNRVLPQAYKVCSAFTGVCANGTLKEKHGNQVTGDLVSNDGASIFDADTATYFTRGNLLSGAWDYSFNGRTSGEKVFVSPLKRVDFPDRATIRHAVAVLRKGDPRPSIRGCSPIRKPELFKVRAEYYGKGSDDGRGNKGLFISARNVGSRISVTTLAGKEVGFLRYYGPFEGGGFRYYLGRGSGETPVQLMRELGSEWGLLKWKGGCRVFNAIRREGYYR